MQLKIYISATFVDLKEHSEFEGTVLGGFGQVLGLLNEHNNPDAAIVWNKQRVYEVLGGPPNNWSKQTIDTAFFTTWSHDMFPFAKPFDPESIMARPVPPEFTKNGMSIGGHSSLSPRDKEFISRLYPYPDGAPSQGKRGHDEGRPRSKR